MAMQSNLSTSSKARAQTRLSCRLMICLIDLLVLDGRDENEGSNCQNMKTAGREFPEGGINPLKTTQFIRLLFIAAVLGVFCVQCLGQPRPPAEIKFVE